MSRVVMVTGVSRYLGGRFAQLLQTDPGIDRVIGVDVVPPAEDLGRTEFVRADIRNPIIAKVIAQAEVDTVVHMSVIATPLVAGGRTSMKEINVIGTMQLLAACQKAPSVRKLVVKSSSTVYGSSAKDPAMFTEGMEPRALPRAGFAKDSVEVEGYVRGFARRRPDVGVTMLRFANFIGPRVETAMTAYFSLPVVPTPLGFDARLQFVHEDDGMEVLRRATVEDHPGTYNVAGPGVLLLSQAVRRAGRVALPVPAELGGTVGQLFRRAGLADFSPEQMRFLSHGRGLDCTRLRERIGYEPRYSTPAAFDDFVAARGLGGPLSPQPVAAAEAAVRRALRLPLEVVGRA
ncbi:MAG TPA: NAD-dependent epimerase/dehydratase family protein [Motilibacteraceae bacterium]|nr:NAD-dependent epimerase/dehydratase family protein [Motilibacteraceae bacterium]